MVKPLPIGPYKTIEGSDKRLIPWYMLQFDADGRSMSPRTMENCLQTAAQGFSDIFVCSHGWNNTWKDATHSYEKFLRGFIGLRAKRSIEPPAGYNPLLIGINWPSISLLLPWERPPKMAAVDDALRTVEEEEQVANERDAVAALAELLPRKHLPEFYRLCQSGPDAKGRNAKELIDLLLKHVPMPADWPQRKGKLKTDDVWEAWSRLADDDPGTGRAGMPGERRGGPVKAAFAWSDLDPRNWIVRGFTVWMMKDRAKVVGAAAMAPLLQSLAANDARLHLLGHSYGCQVMLEALVTKGWGKKQVDSALLLQPAVSAHCFAKEVHKTKEPGRYRPALARCRLPIAATFSRRDAPLHKWYHRFVDRYKDAGERRPPEMARPREMATTPEIADYYAALGGYGPQGCSKDEMTTLSLGSVGETYDSLPDSVRLIGLESTSVIGGHGDIHHPEVYWYLHRQLQQREPGDASPNA